MANAGINARIEAEIIRALKALGASPATLSLSGTCNAEGGLSAALERLGAPVELLSIVGSIGDTLTDAEALEALKTYNRGEAMMNVDLDAREIEEDRAMMSAIRDGSKGGAVCCGGLPRLAVYSSP